MRVKRLILVGFLLFSAQNLLWAGDRPAYLDSRLPVEKRLDDLLARMTLEEKVGQMCQYVGLEHQREVAKKKFGEHADLDDAHGFYPNLSPRDVERLVVEGKIGSFLHVVTAEEANTLQKLALKSRLKIPLLIGIDAIHGNGLVRGATIYPTPLTLASAWDPALVEAVGRQTAVEMRACGMHWSFTPNVDVARDPRWGRVGETFGEDPYLVSQMGVAMVRGLQSGGGTTDTRVIACAKHMVGGGEPINGLNAAPTDISRRTLFEVFLPPFKAAVDAGAYTVMAAHNEIEGEPCHGSHYLLTDILRGQMGFSGFVVSDWMDIERLYSLHHVVGSEKEAYARAVLAGIDMHMHGP
ncbi:MAG: glycoside hydrolase family 3 protein, partial [Calditrichaeota bacterium]|nr:glycoside hydrolase family 3 protein [Calditrichota bacterium]